MSDFDKETVIGHSVQATVEDPSELRKMLDSVADTIEVQPIHREPMVKITVNDVDWDESKQVRIRRDTLNELVETVNEVDE